jgi:hypothetical protein
VCWPGLSSAPAGKALMPLIVVTKASRATRLARIRPPTGAKPLVRRAGLVEAAGPALRGYVPAAVTARPAAGQSTWISELRSVTVFFLEVGS